MDIKLFRLSAKLFDLTEIHCDLDEFSKELSFIRDICQVIQSFAVKSVLSGAIMNRNTHAAMMTSSVGKGVVAVDAVHSPVQKDLFDTYSGYLSKVLFDILDASFQMLLSESDSGLGNYSIDTTMEQAIIITDSNIDKEGKIFRIKYAETLDLADRLQGILDRMYKYDPDLVLSVAVDGQEIVIHGIDLAAQYIMQASEKVETLHFSRIAYAHSDYRSADPFSIELDGKSTKMQLLDVPPDRLEIVKRKAKYNDRGEVVGRRQLKKRRSEASPTGRFYVDQIHFAGEKGQEDSFKYPNNSL